MGSTVEVSPLRESPGAARLREIDQVESEVAEVCGHLHALHGRLVELVADVLARGLWEQSGVRSPEHWVTWQTGLSRSTATRVVAAARRHGELPVTMAALAAGELALDQVAPIVERAPAWADASVCDLARYATVSQIQRIVAGYPTDDQRDSTAATDAAEVGGDGAEPVGPQADEPAFEPASPHDHHGPLDSHAADGVDDPGVDGSDPERFTLFQLDDGTWRVHGRLDADHGLMLDAALRSIADDQFHTTSRRPRRAETLVELARRHIDGIDVAERRDRYRVQYIVDETCQAVDPMGCSLPGWLRDLITCDADASVCWQRHGTPIAHARSSTRIHPVARRHVQRRDHGRCRVPGCASRVVDVHHIVHREHGGRDHPDNLVLICPWHHRQHHRGHLGISGDPTLGDGHPGSLTFADRHARPIVANRLIRPPNEPPPPPTSRYRHPSGERLQTRWLTHTPPRPPRTVL